MLPITSHDPQLGVGLGAYVDEDNDVVAYVSIGPALVLSYPESKLSIEVGSRAGFLSSDSLGVASLGGQFQFSSYGSVRWRVMDRFEAGVRMQHMSNAGASSANPGVDILGIELVYVP